MVSNRAELVGHGDRELRGLVLDLAEVALAALSPAAGLERCASVDGSRLWVTGRTYDLSGYRRIEVLGAGKASASLALGLDRLLGLWLTGGLVVVPRRPAEASERIEFVEADHPVPSSAKHRGGRGAFRKGARLGRGRPCHLRVHRGKLGAGLPAGARDIRRGQDRPASTALVVSNVDR